MCNKSMKVHCSASDNTMGNMNQVLIVNLGIMEHQDNQVLIEKIHRESSRTKSRGNYNITGEQQP